jgi:hypothetical protein
MKTTYLYGELTQEELQIMGTSKEAVNLKILKAKALIQELLQVPFMTRDWVRMSKVIASIDFNNQILAEIHILTTNNTKEIK